MSVLVAALPAVERSTPPTLRTPDAAVVHRTAQSPWVLPVEGDALVYSTRFAHDVRLEGQRSDGTAFSVPARADAPRGGFVIEGGADLTVDESTPAKLVGQWGFDAFTGPTFHLASPRTRGIGRSRRRIAPAWWPDAKRVIGAQGEGACLFGHSTHRQQRPRSSGALRAQRRSPMGTAIAVGGRARGGPVTLHFTDQGGVESAPVTLTAFQEPSRIDRAHLHVGDRAVTVDGQGLAQLASLEAGGFRFEADADTPIDAETAAPGQRG
jgi:hypothetical protein